MDLLEKIQSSRKEIESAAHNLINPDLIEDFRLKYLSRKGVLNDLFEEMKSLDKDIKAQAGKSLKRTEDICTENF
jgi:hypothetical protein